MKKTVILTIVLVLVIGTVGGLYFSNFQKEETPTINVEKVSPVPTATTSPSVSVVFEKDVIFDGENWNVVNEDKVETGEKFSSSEVGITADLGTFGELTKTSDGEFSLSTR